MNELTQAQVEQVTGAGDFAESFGYAVGYAVGTVASGVGYALGGGAGYDLGILIYNWTH